MRGGGAVTVDSAEDVVPDLAGQRQQVELVPGRRRPQTAAGVAPLNPSTSTNTSPRQGGESPQGGESQD